MQDASKRNAPVYTENHKQTPAYRVVSNLSDIENNMYSQKVVKP